MTFDGLILAGHVFISSHLRLVTVLGLLLIGAAYVSVKGRLRIRRSLERGPFQDPTWQLFVDTDRNNP